MKKVIKVIALSVLFIPALLHATQNSATTSSQVPFANVLLHYKESVNAIYKLVPGQKLTCIIEPAAWYTAEWTFNGLTYKSDIRKDAISFSINEGSDIQQVDPEGVIKLTSLFVWGTDDNVGFARCIYH